MLLALTLLVYTLLAGWRPFSWFPPVVALPIIVGCMILLGRLHQITIPRWWARWYGLLISIFVWSLVSDTVNGSLELNIDRIENLLFTCLFAFFCMTTIRSEKQMRRLLLVVVCGVSLSAAVAILQISPYREPFLAVWRWRYDMTNSSPETMERIQTLYTFILNRRAAGLTPYSLNLAHQIVQALPLAACLFLTEIRRTWQAFVLWCLVAHILGAISTGARIAIFIGLGAFGASLLYVKRPISLLSRRGRSRLKCLLMAIIVIAVLVVPLSQALSLYKIRLLTEGEKLRVATWLSVGALFVERPQALLLGLGGGGFTEWGRQAGVLGSLHNQLLGTLVEFGLPGLLLLLSFYAMTFRTVRYVKIDQFGRLGKAFVYQRCYVMSLLAYIVASLFHDQGPFTGDLFHLMLLSIFVTLPKCQ